MNLLRILETMSAAAPEELCCLGMSACCVRPVAMSYTMGTMMLTGSWGSGMRWVSCNCEPKQTKHTGFETCIKILQCTKSVSRVRKAKVEVPPTLTKKSILDLSTTAMVPGGAIGGALGGMVRQNWTFHFSCAAWSGNCGQRQVFIALSLSSTQALPVVYIQGKGMN